MPKPWICWKAPRAPKAPEPSKEVVDSRESRDSRTELKKFLQFKALQTKCHQRQVSLRQSQQSLKAAAERWRRAEERRSSLRSIGRAACAPRGPAAPEPAVAPQGPPPGLPRTAEMWRAEAGKLRAALEERKMLNQCLRVEVDTLERAFHSLIELGDQQMADLYCIQERNDSLREQQQDAHAECREQHSSYWETQAAGPEASPSSVASCSTLVDEMQRTAAAMHRELGNLEAQLLQSRRQADLAQQEAVVLAQQQLQAAMKPEVFSSPRSHLGLRLEADFAVDPEDQEEMEALGRNVSIQETCSKDAPAPVEGLSQDLQLQRSELEVAAQLTPGTAALEDAQNALRAAAAVPESGPERLQHLSENQQLELHILHCKERLQQRLLKEQIAQLRLKAELQRLRGR